MLYLNVKLKLHAVCKNYTSTYMLYVRTQSQIELTQSQSQSQSQSKLNLNLNR